MEYLFTPLPKSEVEIQVILPFEEFEPHVKRAATLITEETEIEGFRKGKAPYEVVKSRVGELAIYERAAELAVRHTYPEIMEKLKNDGELNLDRPPIGKPEITVTKLAPGNELQYKIKIAILPEVNLPDYRTITKKILGTRREVRLNDEEVGRALSWLQESRTKLTIVDRPAITGDSVEVDFEIQHQGVKIEQGESKNHPVIIGKHTFIPGFEEQLIGMRKGEEKTFTLIAPEQWHEKSLAGKSLEFRVRAKEVRERGVPELNDEFAKGVGNFPSYEALTMNVRDGLLKEKEEKEIQRIRGSIIEAIAKEAEIEIPDILIHSELEKMFDEMRSGIQNLGMKWEDYLLHIKKTMEDLAREWRGEAEKRVRAALCLREIAMKENIDVNDEEVETRANEFLKQFGSAEDAKKSIDPAALREYTKGVLRNEKVFEFLETKI